MLIGRKTATGARVPLTSIASASPSQLPLGMECNRKWKVPLSVSKRAPISFPSLVKVLSFLISGLPKNNLYNVNRVAVLGVSRPLSVEANFIPDKIRSGIELFFSL